MKTIAEQTSLEEIPANWEACTRKQIEYLAEHGTYGQRLIANRYLRDWAKDH